RELRQLGGRLEEERSRERATQERLIQGYEGLAALGQIATLLLPVLPQELAQVRGQVQAARRALSAANGHGAAIEQLAATVEAMAGRLESFRWTAGGADRRRAIDIVAEVDTFRRALDPVLRSRDIRLEIECPEREVVRTEMRPEHFHCVLHILAGNS